jgi:protein-S-isoprenylcysteine O-methyltransferase Ste14
MTDGSTKSTPDSARNSARANSFPWPPVLLVAAIAGAWLLGRTLPLAWPGLDDTAAHVIGFGFGFSGFVLVAWSIKTLINAGTTVMPDGVSKVLVTSGPYALFRNPIYLGEVLLLLFFAEWSKNIWFVVAGVLFAILVTALQIIPEERHLAGQFGDAYDAYRAKTRRWI